MLFGERRKERKRERIVYTIIQLHITLSSKIVYNGRARYVKWLHAGDYLMSI